MGDVTPDRAKADGEKYFGDWKASGPKPDVIPKPVPLNPPSYTVVENSYASQDQVLLGQMLDLNLHNPDRYALTLGNDVLGGNGFASRLMVDIRVKHGYAYGAGSGMSFQSFALDVLHALWQRSLQGRTGGRPAQQESAGDAEHAVKETELNNARQYQIRSIPVGVSSVNRIARSLLTWSYNGEPLNQPMVAAKHYLKLTAEQVQAAFKKYLQPKHLVQVVMGPKPPKH